MSVYIEYECGSSSVVNGECEYGSSGGKCVYVPM